MTHPDQKRNFPAPAVKLAWAMVASATLHLALIVAAPKSLLPFWNDEEASGPPLTAELAAAPPAPAAARAAVKPAQPRPRRSPPKLPLPEQLPAMPAEPLPEKMPAQEHEQTTAPAAPSEQPPEQEPPQVQLPARAELQYTLFKGAESIRVGKVIHQWQVEGDRYRVKSVLEASGLFALFYWGQLIQASEGTVTPRGLRPDAYRIQRGNAEETETATFEWAALNLVLGSTNGSRTVYLPPNAQDQLSFLHNMPFITPEAGSYRMIIASSRKVDTYDYDVVDEELLETEAGPIKTIHLRKRRGESVEGADVWLAPEHYLLPVKIQITDKNGDTVQQVISRIEVQP